MKKTNDGALAAARRVASAAAAKIESKLGGETSARISDLAA